MGKSSSSSSRKYLCNKNMSPIKHCGICGKFLNERGITNRSGTCSGCRNDCLNGSFGNVRRNIDKRIEKAIKDSQFHGKVTNG